MDFPEKLCAREITELIEEQTLCANAAKSRDTKGRGRAEEKCELRTEYQRDRDRIIHSASFRRLKHKTQVFISPEGDHYRTRLTHTLEVSQIARTISRALRLNEDLTEAIALGHDLGHTPFGHAGERALSCYIDGGFHHYEQSLRVVDKLEKHGQGLNLTYEVRNGILCHTNMNADTREGVVVRLADRIAYMNHDIDDSIKGGIISENDIPVEIREGLGNTKSQRINTLVKAVVCCGSDEIRMSQPYFDLYNKLHEFLFEAVYKNPVAKGEEQKAVDLIKTLFCYYNDNIDKLPPEYKSVAESDGKERAAADYVSSMTDRYAIHKFNDIFIPESWMVM